LRGGNAAIRGLSCKAPDRGRVIVIIVNYKDATLGYLLQLKDDAMSDTRVMFNTWRFDFKRPRTHVRLETAKRESRVSGR
jgi:hypothetical protein